ncbi:MAG: gamma-glutamylcyclotransferase family protein, partial [Rhizobium sp.]
MTPENRLATYATLAPGRVNHHQLDGLGGIWSRGIVRGRLLQSGWGAALGFPGLELSDDGAEIEVFLFESTDLPAHWQQLDSFEGEGYRRVIATVWTEEGAFEAYIYVLTQARHTHVSG